jgi:hypothetical protein
VAASEWHQGHGSGREGGCRRYGGARRDGRLFDRASTVCRPRTAVQCG